MQSLIYITVSNLAASNCCSVFHENDYKKQASLTTKTKTDALYILLITGQNIETSIQSFLEGFSRIQSIIFEENPFEFE